MTRWQDSALCAQIDPDLWFPEVGAAWQLPARICRRCPVIDQCRQAGAAEEFGVWAGVPATKRPGTRTARKTGRRVAA